MTALTSTYGSGWKQENGTFHISEGGFAGFLRAITVTEQAIARSVDCECPISDATSVRAIALRPGNSLPNTVRQERTCVGK